MHSLNLTVFSCVHPGPLSHFSLSSSQMTTILTHTTRHTPSSTVVRHVCAPAGFHRPPPPLLRLVATQLLCRCIPHRRLQPVVQPHHVPPGAQDAHVQAASQKPLQQRQRRRPSRAFAFRCASSSSSAHALHPAAKGQRQRARQRRS